MLELIDALFALCVLVLQMIGESTGMGYKLANLVIFIFVQPGLILLFFILWRIKVAQFKQSEAMRNA
tara:strand:+ start:527 stop:727 length:201 start_codon:yes stop_codon:yes gene_type:complete